jgi:hypothetical protein
MGAALAMWLVASTAWASGPAPTVEHQPLTSVPSGKPVEFRVRLLSNSAKPIFNPTLYFRVPTVGPSYSRVDLKPIAGVSDLYAATLPADLVTGDFDYYVEAYDEDGNGPARVGSDTAPVHVTVVQRHRTDVPAAGTDPKATPAGGLTRPAAAPVAKSRTVPYALLGVGVGAVVVGGVLIAAGVFTYPDQTSLDDGTASSTGNDVAIISGVGLGVLGVISAAVGGGMLLSSDDAPQKVAEVSHNPGIAGVVLDFQPPRFNGLPLGLGR